MSTDSFAKNFGYSGLNDEEVKRLRALHGRNEVEAKDSGLSDLVKGFLRDPMLLLLVVACVIYFTTGQPGDAMFMLFAIGLTISISLYQDRRSRKALEALQALTLPHCRVIRNGAIISIATNEVVPGDLLLAEEGLTIAADGIVVHSNDFSVNESILTGEAFAIDKNSSDNNRVYQGTTVTRGLAVCEVTATGSNTELGKIGKTLESIAHEETPLEKQVRVFVARMAWVGICFFAVVWILNYYDSQSVADSLLKSLSLAMSILPEEIPVAFATFMALGAWRLTKLGVIVKRTSIVETLGSATVICVDKTGTITKNRMELQSVYAYTSATVEQPASLSDSGRSVIDAAMWASEPIPFDPMEVALHNAYAKSTTHDERPQYKMIHEYPLGGRPPMMTHIFENASGQRIVSAKGAPEAIFEVCHLSASEIEMLRKVVSDYSSAGSRVLGVATAAFTGNDFPKDQRAFPFAFVGLVAFYDPPKDNMKAVIRSFHGAGIEVKMITGDHPETAVAIGKQIGLGGDGTVLTGDQLRDLSDDEVRKVAGSTSVFARMFPDAKLKILRALKANGHIVAMTGDGVNDGPALKSAHIGVAMGRGTETARQVSSLILSDDDLGKMVDAVAAGRRIYVNLKKAIQYIISIHTPIILVVFIPLALGWLYPTIFTPVHVIFLEMIMGPTCSIVYENEPLEPRLMKQRPRPITRTFFNAKELIISVAQGLVIAVGVLGMYLFAVDKGYDEQSTRAMVFVTLISANIFLTIVNRSTTEPFWSYRTSNNLIPIVILITLALMGMMLYVGPVSNFFRINGLPVVDLLTCMAVGGVSVVWIEFWKMWKR